MKKTVLLVEDSKVQKVATQRRLVDAGYLVLTAEDGEEALRLAHEAVPDLILLDMVLPKKAGFEVLIALKIDRATFGIPVIVLSILPQLDEVTLKNNGAAAYFPKSRLNADEQGEQDLMELIRQVLSEPGERTGSARSAANHG